MCLEVIEGKRLPRVVFVLTIDNCMFPVIKRDFNRAARNGYIPSYCFEINGPRFWFQRGNVVRVFKRRPRHGFLPPACRRPEYQLSFNFTP